MAKGSKAWYEVYENAIYEFEKQHFTTLDLPDENRMGNMGIPTDNKSSNILSTKAGAFSPSRLNIAIGQISLIIWIILYLIHTILNYHTSKELQSLFFNGLTIVLNFISLGISIYLVKGKYLKSSFL